MGTITLSDRQQRQVRILQRLTDHTLTTEQAAQLLGKSVRQVWRLKAAFQNNGMTAVLHGNQGREPTNKTPQSVKDKLRELAGQNGVYKHYNTSHLTEVLAREHAIVLSRATLDRLLVLEGLRKRSQPTERLARKRRKRRPSEGTMLQIDGSTHKWFGEDHPPLCLLGAIDDATGKIAGLLFRPTEDQAGYLTLLRNVATQHGLPESLYHDKHTILRSPKEASLEDELAGTAPKSQVQRVLDLLGVASITAHSPQAKGRIERLWGTLQDRLIKELLAASVSTSEAASAFLPAFIARFNQTFARQAADPQTAWVAMAGEMDLDYYFSAMLPRLVKSDHTIAYLGQTLQLLPDKSTTSLRGQQVQVHALPEGTLKIYHQKGHIPHKVLPAPLPKEATARAPAAPVDPAQRKANRRKQTAYLYASAG